MLAFVILLLIHACARIATNEYRGPDNVAEILIHACVRIVTDSLTSGVAQHGILIHACAKIAAMLYSDAVLIHACARIATPQETERRTLFFDSCMREDFLKIQNMDKDIFRFMHVRGLQQTYSSILAILSQF